MLKVVASGLEDRVRLNPPDGKPRTNLYRYVLKRRTRWASQWRYVPMDGRPDFGRTVTTTLPQDGELVTRAVLVIQPPDLFGMQGAAVYPNWVWTNSLGHALIESVGFSLSNVPIDTIDGQLLEILEDTDGPVEHLTTTNQRLARDPSLFPMASVDGTPCPPLNAAGLFPDYQAPSMLLHVVPPFWWNKGPGPNALMLQALAQEKVQLTVSFRTIDQVVIPLYPYGSVADGTTQMTGSPLYDGSGAVIGAMPAATEWHLPNAFWLVEYVSLESREASAYRLADLQIPIRQHLAAPVVSNGGAVRQRVPLEATGLIQDMTIVAQNSAATANRAWFNFGRDLSCGTGRQSDLVAAIQRWAPIIAKNNPAIYAGFQPYLGGMLAAAAGSLWWPNAYIPDWNYSDGYYLPSSTERFTDPIEDISLTYRGATRFELSAAAMRSLGPALNCRRTPFVNRYIHRFDFGFCSGGGLAEALECPDDQIRGTVNWDKLPNKELQIRYNRLCGDGPTLLTLRVWFTRVNMLRIFAGRAALMFDA